jgi:hypothetical protein
MATIRITAIRRHGHWSAYLPRCTEKSFGGPTAVEAVRRLVLETYGFSPTELLVRNVRENLHEFAVRLPACPECGGSGQYVGLIVVEPCRRCGGSGVEVGAGR